MFRARNSNNQIIVNRGRHYYREECGCEECEKMLIYWDDFKIETTEWPGFPLDPTRNPLGTPNWEPSVFIQAPPPIIELLAQGVIHEDGCWSITNESLWSPEQPPGLGSDFLFTQMVLRQDWGIKECQCLRFDAIASTEFNVNTRAAIETYGAENLDPKGPLYDMRINFVMIALPIFDVNLGGNQLGGLALNNAFFITEKRVFAAHNAIPLAPDNLDQRHSGWVFARPVAEFDTSKPHKYSLEYDRCERCIKWYIDGHLVFKHRRLGFMPNKQHGDYWYRLRGRDGPADPHVSNYAIMGGNKAESRAQIEGVTNTGNTNFGLEPILVFPGNHFVSPTDNQLVHNQIQTFAPNFGRIKLYKLKGFIGKNCECSHGRHHHKRR